jgi:hypothetical protein
MTASQLKWLQWDAAAMSDTCSDPLSTSKQDSSGELFGVHWHSIGVLYATSRRSLSHWCDPRSLLRNDVCQQWPYVILSRMVEAQGCRGLVAKAGEVAREVKLLEQQSLGDRPQEACILGKGLGGKLPGVYGLGIGGITWGCHELDIAPGSSPAPWMEKPPGGSPDHPEVW